MDIGVPREIKNHEYRVAVTPAGVAELTAAGHSVKIESAAGQRIGYSDDDYRARGATIVEDAEAVYRCPLVVKVKEPQPREVAMLHEGQVLFTYLHLAPDIGLTRSLLERRIVGIAYETVTDTNGSLPLLIPMSEIAGRLSIQAGATALQMAGGGCGVLLGGVPGVGPARVVIVGGGVVGTQAARMALGLGAEVTVLDKSLLRLRHLDDLYGPRLHTVFSDRATLDEYLPQANLVVGAVLVPGHAAPKLIKRRHLSMMRPGSVFVDVAIDQGGCAETSRPTTHSDPLYVEEGVVHYCVANMPGAVSRTATQALTNATLPYLLALADKGWRNALHEDATLLSGLNVCSGQLTNAGVAEATGYSFVPPEQAVGVVVGQVA